MTQIRVLPDGEVVINTGVHAEAAAAPAAPRDAGAPLALAGAPRSTALTPLVELGIKLCVFDMAGTTVDEGGLVYDTLKRVMREEGWNVPDDEFNAWHGANKKEVVEYFAGTNGAKGRIDAVYQSFNDELEAVYFKEDSPVKPMPGVYEYFEELRAAGIKIGLDTGFPRKIADHIIAQLNFGPYIDGSCVAMEVGHGRPYPYMVYNLMHKFAIEKACQVAKFGDTNRDIEEGLNAGTPYVYGCLSGADNEETLLKAGAYRVVKTVMDVPVGGAPNGGAKKRKAEAPLNVFAKRKFANGVH